MDEMDADHAGGPADGTPGARPRRADAETLTYLRSLEPLIEQSVRALDERRQQQQGGRRGGGEEEDGADAEATEDRALLVSNLIDELTYKVRTGLVGLLGGYSPSPTAAVHVYVFPHRITHTQAPPPDRDTHKPNSRHTQVASLAMDRHAAPVLEKLARLCTRRQLARLLTGCQGYAHALASNRYSSHVLQVGV